MSQVGLYLGGGCPPNMEAYLDSLLFRTDGTTYDLIVTDSVTVPEWLQDTERITVRPFDVPAASGVGLVGQTRKHVRRYLHQFHPDVVRQITQPRWHAPGVLLGALGANVDVYTRVSASMFTEYREAPSRAKAWLVNNGLGRSVFLGEKVYTPKYGGISLPWWSRAERVTETRIVNGDRFSPDVEPNPDLFSTDGPRVLTVGRVSRRKGIDLVVAVADRLPEFEFAVVGPVSDESIASDCRDRDNIRLHDPVDYIEMPPLYTASDVVLSTSRVEWGGVSRAMLEGKTSGRPVVALDNEHASEVVDRAVEADPDAIATALEALV